MSIITTTRQSTFAEVCAEMDRRGEVIERLEAALRAAEAERDRMRKEVVVLKAAMAWTDEVYPETTEARGARVDMTWVEFNRMREAIGLPPRKVRGRAALQSTSAKEGE